MTDRMSKPHLESTAEEVFVGRSVWEDDLNQHGRVRPNLWFAGDIHHRYDTDPSKRAVHKSEHEALGWKR